MKNLRSIALLAAGSAIGLKFADVDQALPWLVHRSILTHSFFACLLLSLWAANARPLTTQDPRWFAIGFALATSVHLCFDLFPRSWYKHALISIPFYGWTSPLFSWLWIAGSAILCCYCALLLMRSRGDRPIASGALLASYAFAASAEQRIAVPSLIALAISTFIALVLSHKRE